jgi:hypothetical protein
MKPMSSRELLHGSALGLTMLGLAVCVLAACATQQQAATPVPPAAADQASTEGTVNFTGGAVALGIGFQWGSGTLTFRGREYPFSVRGLSVVDVGAARVTATGTVQNLRNVADFSGNYVAVSAGGAVAGGGSVGALRNQNGVVINGITTQQGLRVTLAASGLGITLTGQ